jgi:4-amino-4-deoxy-L-arabinose transferase-like glycosyltransferase
MIKRYQYQTITLLLFIVCIYFRIDFIRSVSHSTSGDADNYINMANQIINKGVYGYNSLKPNAFVTPGYPIFLVICFKLAKWIQIDVLTFVRFIQVLLSVITAFFIFKITFQVSKRRIAALIALAVTTIYPPFIWANGAILTEVLANFFLMIYTLFQFYAFEKEELRYYIFAGVSLGFLVLVRPEFVLIPFVCIAIKFLINKKDAKFKYFFFEFLLIICVLAPWWIRNEITLHKFIPLATQTNPLFAGTFPNNNFDDNMIDLTGKTELEGTVDRLKVGFTKHTWTFVKWYTIGKLNYLFGMMYYGGGYVPYYPIKLFPDKLHNILIYFGFFALCFSLINWRRFYLISTIIILMTVIRLAFIPVYRYNFSIIPFFIILVSAEGIEAYQFIKRRVYNIVK